jgi:pimeloyl-ACP methyl ester carboxylesterase
MPDLRGHGWSEAPETGYEKERLAADLIELLDQLEIERVGYVGHDWGAWLGFLLGFAHSDRLRGLLALSIPHPWPSRRDRLNPLRLAALAYQLPLSAPFVGERLMRAGLARTVVRAGSSNGHFSSGDLDLYGATMASPARARATVALYRTFLLRELPAVARGRYADAQLNIPIRLIVGEDEPIVRGADLRGYESHAPQMTVERAAGAAHFLPEERPELVAAHIEEMFGEPRDRSGQPETAQAKETT